MNKYMENRMIWPLLRKLCSDLGLLDVTSRICCVHWSTKQTKIERKSQAKKMFPGFIVRIIPCRKKK